MSELTPAEELAMLANTPNGERPVQPFLKQINLRIPLDLLAEIDAVNSVTGVQGRNALLIALLRAGVYEVVQNLDDHEQYYSALSHFQSEYFNEQEQE